MVEEKYTTVKSCCTQVLWMKQTLKDIKIEYDHPILILCDNANAINISKNLIMHTKMKHIPIKYYFFKRACYRETSQDRLCGHKETNC